MIKKNICFFNSSKTWGGGEKWHFDMALRLNDEFFSTFVIAGKNSALFHRLDQTPVPHEAISISNYSFLNPFKIFKIFKILKRQGIQTIIINLSEDLKVACPAAKLAGVKNIIYRRGSAIPIKNSLSNRLIFKHLITGIIANSKETKRTILQNNPGLFPPDKITVIYNGIDLKEYDQSPAAVLYQRKPLEIILGNAGRLSHEKGQEDLIKIAGELKRKNIPLKLLIAGDGQQKKHLQNLARSQGVAEEVIFLGFVENMKGFMETIDIFLMTSLWEGFGYVLIEAMAARKPIIAFDINTTTEIVQDLETGFIVKDRNLQPFIEKIERLRADCNLCSKMGNAGRERVEKIFDIKTTVKGLKGYLDAASAQGLRLLP